jgi:hypothetical protein
MRHKTICRKCLVSLARQYLEDDEAESYASRILSGGTSNGAWMPEVGAVNIASGLVFVKPMCQRCPLVVEHAALDALGVYGRGRR